MSEIQTVGVVGAGTMGHGIAQVAAMSGFRTRLYDVGVDRAVAGMERISSNLQIGVEKKKITPEQRAETMARLSPTGELKMLASCDLVIEAAPEDIELKKKLFGELSRVCSPQAILATNTSSLSITELASAATNPERVVGMHFFNPVHLMKLLEIVKAHQTSNATVARARAIGERLGKELVVVQDSPGFASSRLGLVLGLEAIRMLEEGVGTAADIDRAMELGYGHPMGPLKLTDLVGLDVRLAIAEYLYRELGTPTFRPPQLLKKMVRAGKLGKKSGEGFYPY
jgi:3-hydroxybutyryl-CoA dehydrogenase